MNTSLRNWILPAALLLFVLVLISCSKDRDEGGVLSPHPEGWMTQSSENFHGWPAIRDSARGCHDCHGATLEGGATAQSCYDCHRYLHIQVTIDLPETHQKLVALDDEWHIQNCTFCHGADFAAPIIRDSLSCRTCHTGSNGPATCGTCHGMPPLRNAADSVKVVPYGMVKAAAGAHDKHERFGCRECHGAANGLSHVDALPAEVTFERAVLADTLETNTSFSHLGAANSGDGTCSNIYCHSDGHPVNGRVGPPVAGPPNWVTGALTCGGCHRVPPPTAPHGTPETAQCHTCHQNVDPSSNYSDPSGIRFLEGDTTHVDGHITFGI